MISGSRNNKPNLENIGNISNDISAQVCGCVGGQRRS